MLRVPDSAAPMPIQSVRTTFGPTPSGSRPNQYSPLMSLVARSAVYISYVQHSKQKETLEHRSGWRVAIDLVFPTIATIFIVGVVAGGLASLFQTQNARRDRVEMKRHLQDVEVSGK